MGTKDGINKAHYIGAAVFVFMLMTLLVLFSAVSQETYASESRLETDGGYYLVYDVAGNGEATITNFGTYWDEDVDIVIPSAIDGHPVTKIGYQAFYEDVDYMYKRVNSVVIPGSVKSIEDEAFAYSYMKTLTLKSGLTSIGRDAFRNCDFLESVTIPDTVKTIDEGAFQWCENLKSVKLPASLTSISSYAFSTCSSLSEIVFPNKLISIGSGVFENCRDLENVVIPDTVTEIDSYAFAYCESLKSVKLPENLERLEGEIFQNCTSLTSIVIPDNVRYIDGSSNFSGCTSLTSVTLPKNLESITFSAFYGCTALKSITLPESVERIFKKALGYYWDSDKGCDVKVPGFTIKGYSLAYYKEKHSSVNEDKNYSHPETYAKDNGFKFVKLDPPASSSSDSSSKESSSAKSVKVGTKKTVTAGTVKVTSVKKKTVTFTKAKNKKSVKVPSTVKIGGKKYKVTKVGPKAFTGSKIKIVTLSKNITALAKNAFAKSKVGKIIIKTKFLKKTKILGALKNSKVKTAVVSLGKASLNKKYVKKYRPWFTKPIAGKKVKVKR